MTTSDSLMTLSRNSRLALVTIVSLFVAACDKSATEPEPKVVTVTAYNRLDVAVTLNAAGTLYGSLDGGSNTVLTLPPKSATLTWTNTKRKYSNGTPISDDLNSAIVNLATNQNIIDITNVVDGKTYFTPSITKSFPDTISLEVSGSNGTRCLGYVFGQPLFGFSFGYYELTSSSQLRYYRGSSCRNGAAAYRFWSATTITNSLTIGSGTVYLNADVLP